ncbi:sensor histidine kinase [Pengzhenrongella sicca]|uniref:histidine kinase n=1 Tax=Pengzhenrongella sicca TaxID=2819238 RepID=A0A8A4Z925_9MICO|nr:ATP-binding protein [Pengzhenrongella sicca]QTE27921.1 HAMP domain-containing protein [Pengzhenrongella sicca]
MSAKGPRRWLPGWSLRLRLTVLTAGLLCVALAVGAIALTAVLSRSRLAALDDGLRERVATVAGLVADDRVPVTLPVAEPGEIVQLLDGDGLVVASSTTASRTLPVLPAPEVAALRREAGGEPLVRTTRASAYDPSARVAVLATTHDGAPVTVVASVPLGQVQGLLRALAISLGAVVPILTAGLAVAIWVVLGRALDPVEQLRRAAAQVARAGGPGSLPVPPARDEVGALARTLNEMLDRLEVGAARQRAFVADAAHELRSPLAALRASIEVAQAHPDAYRPAELARDLEDEVLRMQGLVDDLLVLARVGSTPVVRTAVDLAPLVRAAVDVAQQASARADVQVERGGDGGAFGDEAAIGRVVRNLLDNAVRHAAGRVRVTVAPGTVTVEDDGPGVADADRERVFERFVRLEDAREREAGGTGLGLAIAREIAREHDGDVLLAASELGGLRATLRLPVD